MARITYKPKKFGTTAQAIITMADQICADSADQGFDLTLRQLYYQFVARGVVPNQQAEYNRIGRIINEARLAGLLDWNYIVDRTRNMEENPHWRDPSAIIESASKSYGIDKWEDQDNRVEVWIEKDALVGVIEGVCGDLDCPYFSCRGYTSQSEMWRAAQRLIGYSQQGQTPIIIHLGDHDPSGIDMTRDIDDRLTLFMTSHGFSPPKVHRLALTLDQIDEHNPPPNPAKLSDSRAEDYIRLYGADSWELDALDPILMSDLIRKAIESYRDDDLWEEKVTEEETGRDLLIEASSRWSEVVTLLE